MANKIINTKAVFRRIKKEHRVNIQKFITDLRTLNVKVDAASMNLEPSNDVPKMAHAGHVAALAAREVGVNELVNFVRAIKTSKNAEQAQEIFDKAADSYAATVESVKRILGETVDNLQAQFATDDTPSTTKADAEEEIEFYQQATEIGDWIIPCATDVSGRRLAICARSRGGSIANLRKHQRTAFFDLFNAKNELAKTTSEDEIRDLLEKCKRAYNSITVYMENNAKRINDRITKVVLEKHPDAIFTLPVKEAKQMKLAEYVKEVDMWKSKISSVPTIAFDTKLDTVQSCVTIRDEANEHLKAITAEFSTKLDGMVAKGNVTKDLEELSRVTLGIHYMGEAYEREVYSVTKKAEKAIRRIVDRTTDSQSYIIEKDHTEVKSYTEEVITKWENKLTKYHLADPDDFKNYQQYLNTITVVTDAKLKRVRDLYKQIDQSKTKREDDAILENVKAVQTEFHIACSHHMEHFSKPKDTSQRDTIKENLIAFIESLDEFHPNNEDRPDVDGVANLIYDEWDKARISEINECKAVVQAVLDKGGDYDSLAEISVFLRRAKNTLFDNLSIVNNKYSEKVKSMKYADVEEEAVDLSDFTVAAPAEVQTEKEKARPVLGSAMSDLLRTVYERTSSVVSNRIGLINSRDAYLQNTFGQSDVTQTRKDVLTELIEVQAELRERDLNIAELEAITSRVDDVWNIYHDHIENWKPVEKEALKEPEVETPDENSEDIAALSRTIENWVDSHLEDPKSMAALKLIGKVLYGEFKNFLRKYQ